MYYVAEVGKEKGKTGEAVWCRCCGVVKALRQKKQSAIYHESSRTQPKVERKCDVSFGMCWCVLVFGVVWCGCWLCCGLSVVVW